MKQLGQKWAKYFIIFITVVLIFNGCEKINDSQIPNVPFTLEINLIIMNDLTVPTNSRYFPNIGFGGVIVSCESPGVYYAYDAACTHEINQSCKIKNEGILGTCECCGSQFLLIYEAYPTSGPAPAPLKQYKVAQVNSFTLRVYNY
jgi:Rieske Fe-S protein